MGRHFIKLKVFNENKSLYIRPEDIIALSWNEDSKCTKLSCLHGAEVFQDEVEETPGVIFAKCDKVTRQ